MKYTVIIFALLFVSHLSFAQTEPLEGKENAVELDKEIEGKKNKTKVYPIGSSKIPASNEPLFIIEDIVVDSNMLNALDPNTIQKIDVLKDEKATAKYGEKGKNGVIIVTLKKKYAKKFKKEHQKKK